MKLLVYGIDGGDLEIFKIFKHKMPFLFSFIEKNTSIVLEEDLINRGWVEILTGKKGDETRGFYMAPLLDGTHKFSTNFKMSFLDHDQDIVPMWDILENRNIPYCIMNVPTTTPVPKVKNGIMVGSAGGGLNKVEGIPDELISDKKLKKYLDEKKYIVDIRIPNEDIKSTEELYNKLEEKESKRVECFIDLCRMNSSEFGFLVNRGNTIVKYLSLYEIIEYSKNKNSNNWVFPFLENHFSSLDKHLKKLFDDLKPEYFIITADHGMLPSKNWANVNVFLEEFKFLKLRKSGSQVDKIKKVAKRLLGKKFKEAKNKLSKNLIDSLGNYDWSKSVAFGSTYIPGIYINDERFMGRKYSTSEYDHLINDICQKFNQIPSNDRLNMNAVPYRQNHLGQKHSDCLPDIKIEGSEGVFFSEKLKTLIRENENYGPIPKDLSKVNHAAFTGDKGPNPIFVCSKNVVDYMEDDDSKDLTVIYNLINRILQK